MRLRLSVLVGTLAVALTLSGSALAFDCLRVSSSLQGLKQSTNGGHWLLFDMTDPTVIAASLSNFGPPLTPAQAQCISTAYLTSGYTPYFALGFGVAGGFTNGPGVLAHNNKNESVLSNLKGIDHLDASPIGHTLFGAVGGCLAAS